MSAAAPPQPSGEVVLSSDDEHGKRPLLLAATTWLWGYSHPASYVMDFIFRRSDGSRVSVDTVLPSLLRYSSFSSPRWYHLESLSSDVVLVLSVNDLAN